MPRQVRRKGQQGLGKKKKGKRDSSIGGRGGQGPHYACVCLLVAKGQPEGIQCVCHD